MALTRLVLDVAHCSGCSGDRHTHGPELFLVGNCHAGRGVDAVYNQETGLLTLRCHQCKRHVGDIKVAAE
jgi:hypothetical protein